jgi:hypothetical protein
MLAIAGRRVFKSTFRDSEDMFNERAVSREVEVGILGLHIGRAVVIVDT